MIQGLTFLSQGQRSNPRPGCGNRRHGHSLQSLLPPHHPICRLEEQQRKPQSSSRCPGGVGIEKALWRAWAEGLASLIWGFAPGQPHQLSTKGLARPVALNLPNAL